MKRIMGILSLAVMASPAMAENTQSASNIDERVLRILKAATTVEPMASPASEPSTESDPQQAERIQAQQPDETSKTQPDSEPIQAQQPDETSKTQPDSGPIPSSCTKLRDEIERKIRANGVPRFSVDVLPTVEAESRVALDGERHNAGEIVGSCAAGRYKIIYRRG
nr:DUF1161 domain-containing protein [uncultured Halomonas sp.]